MEQSCTNRERGDKNSSFIVFHLPFSLPPCISLCSCVFQGISLFVLLFVLSVSLRLTRKPFNVWLSVALWGSQLASILSYSLVSLKSCYHSQSSLSGLLSVYHHKSVEHLHFSPLASKEITLIKWTFITAEEGKQSAKDKSKLWKSNIKKPNLFVSQAYCRALVSV